MDYEEYKSLKELADSLDRKGSYLEADLIDNYIASREGTEEYRIMNKDW